MLISVIFARTEDLNEETRASIIQVCVEAHQEDDFKNLFTYALLGGWQRHKRLDPPAKPH